MLNILIKFIFWLLTTISSLIFTPIFTYLNNVFPDLAEIIEKVQYFLQTYLFQNMKFILSFYCNSTGFPREIIIGTFTIVTLLIAMHTFLQTYRLALKIYKKFKP